jgi:DNA-binding LacI/PurR family transcriptional regulator
MLRYHVNVHILEFFVVSGEQVTILQVARRSGVSRMTVSRVLSNDSRVRPETRSRILHVMNQLGYVPNPSARAMRSGRKLQATQASCFALIFGVDTQKADEFFCEIARGVESQAAESQLSALQVHWLDNLENSWRRMQRLFSMEGLCGALLVGQFGLEDIRAVQRVTPHVVLVDCPIPEGARCAGVEADNRGGCRIALEHLHKQGARRVVVLGGPEGHYFTRAMESAAGDFRGRFDFLQVYHTDYSPRMGREVISELVKNGVSFDGVFGNDTLCIGAMRALADQGISIPADVRIVGFDDIPAGEFFKPSLTSVSVDKKKLGAQSVKSLVGMVEGDTTVCDMRVVVNAELILRESA